MGTDIHIVAQYLGSDGKWLDCDAVPRDLEPRNYTLFAILDGVRKNGMKNPPKPICTTGAPNDFAEEDRGQYDQDAFYKDKWMGYGACGHATLAEILAYDLDYIIESERYPPSPLRDSVGDWIERLQRFFAPLRPECARIVWGYDS